MRLEGRFIFLPNPANITQHIHTLGSVAKPSERKFIPYHLILKKPILHYLRDIRTVVAKNLGDFYTMQVTVRLRNSSPLSAAMTLRLMARQAGNLPRGLKQNTHLLELTTT